MTTKENIIATIKEYTLLERYALKAGNYFLAEYYYNLRKELETEIQ